MTKVFFLLSIVFTIAATGVGAFFLQQGAASTTYADLEPVAEPVTFSSGAKFVSAAPNPDPASAMSPETTVTDSHEEHTSLQNLRLRSKRPKIMQGLEYQSSLQGQRGKSQHFHKMPQTAPEKRKVRTQPLSENF